MLTVKKIGRISRVKGHRLKSGKGLEHCASPLPTVADDVVHAKRACSARIRAYRARIPMLNVEVAVLFVRRFVAPRIVALDAVLGGAVRGAMKLLFAGEFAAEP